MKNNSRLGLWVIIPGWILAFAARMAQICAGTDMTSGFLKYDNGFFMNACFWGAVILTLAGAAAAAFFDRRNGSAYYQTPVERVTDNKAAVIGFGLLLPAMGALYEGYSEAVIPEGSNISPSPFMMVVNFVFGAVMLITSFVILYKKEFKPGLGFAMTGGAVYYTLRGIGVFLERMAVTTRPEYLINCMTDIVAAVLFMQMAKLLSGNEGKRTREVLTVTGAVSVSMILGNAIAIIAASLMGPADVASHIVTSNSAAEMLFQLNYGYEAYYMSWAPASEISVGIFAVAALAALYMKPSDKPAQQPETTESESFAETPGNILPAEESGISEPSEPIQQSESDHLDDEY